MTDAGGRATPGQGRPIVLACDRGFAMQLATCLRSLVEANRASWPLECHLLTDGFSDELRTRVCRSLPEGSASIHWVFADLEEFRRFVPAGHLSTMCFARLLIPRVLGDRRGRVLYLDTDTLVLDDLSPIWDTDLEGLAVAAVIDDVDRHIKADTPGFERVPRVRSYFNSGVLLIDLDQWRKERISERAFDVVRTNAALPYADQDALNVVCDGRWKALDTRWNYQGHLQRKLSDLPKNPKQAVVHFVTKLKPWKVSNLSTYAVLFNDFRDRTLFARTVGERVVEAMQRCWYRSRRLLGRIAPVRAARDYLVVRKARSVW
jgi:lipopolysaccharide biosynthesis glycosyltransferase